MCTIINKNNKVVIQFGKLAGKNYSGSVAMKP